MNIQSNSLSSSERKVLLINSTLLQPWLRSFLPVTKMEISQLRSRYSGWEVILEYSIVTIVFGCLLVLTWSAKLLRTAQNGWNLDWPRKLSWECGILVRVNGANNEEKKILLWDFWFLTRDFLYICAMSYLRWMSFDPVIDCNKDPTLSGQLWLKTT